MVTLFSCIATSGQSFLSGERDIVGLNDVCLSLFLFLFFPKTIVRYFLLFLAIFVVFI